MSVQVVPMTKFFLRAPPSWYLTLYSLTKGQNLPLEEHLYKNDEQTAPEETDESEGRVGAGIMVTLQVPSALDLSIHVLC